MTPPQRVARYEIIDHGIDHAQYYPGCGTAYTGLDDAYTGAGDNPYDALEDALDCAAMDGWDVSAIPNDLPDHPALTADDNEECYYYVAIRVAEAAEEEGIE